MLEEMIFSRDDFMHSNWRDVIALTERRTCENYATPFVEAARQAKEAAETNRYQIFLLLHSISFLMLKPEDRYQPFAPVVEWANGSRSVDISDFAESHVTLLKEIFDQIDDPDLRSRAGDVIWTCQHRGNFRYAEAAIDAYLESGEKLLLAEHYSFGEERFTRAIHLAASLGKNSGKLGDVIARIEALVDQHAPAYSPFIGHLLDLLYNYRQGNPEKNASVAEAFAEFDQERRAWYLARAHWNAAARWHRLGERSESARACQLKEAECYVFEAEDALNNPQGMRQSVAARHMQSAIEALRKIPGTEARQRELHIRMLELRANSRDELGSITQELDLTPQVEKAILAVKDKSFQEALFTLCLLGSSPHIQNLREMVEGMAAKHPLLFWISMNVLNERGRVVGRRDSMFSGTPEEVEAAKIAEMHRRAHYEQDALAIVVNSARLQILIEHTPDLRDFLELTANNPFIPPGREWIFARGYLAGFQGDFLEALHLLVLQVENSLRYLLNRQGVVTSSLSSEGIQEEFGLNALLEMPRLKQILGEDLVFDLEGTLTSRFGSNFRNLMAHGLFEQQAFYSPSATYIWWLLLRICCLPLIIAQQQEENKDAATPNQ
ncbi:hypothetical protein ES703_63457 [subsurface metagenome]